MKLVSTLSTSKLLQLVAMLHIAFSGTTKASTDITTNATPSSGMPTVPASKAVPFHPNFSALNLSPVNRNQGIRRTKRGAKKDGKRGKKNGNYNDYTARFKCKEKSTPLNNGGTKITKKCVHQYFFGNNSVKTANGSGRTKAPVSMFPSSMPSNTPSKSPTLAPTSAPTFGPTVGPTAIPTSVPTSGATTQPQPTAGPTSEPIEILTSRLPSVDNSDKPSRPKTAMGALVGGALCFVVLGAGAKAVASARKRNTPSETSLGPENQA